MNKPKNDLPQFERLADLVDTLLSEREDLRGETKALQKRIHELEDRLADLISAKKQAGERIDRVMLRIAEMAEAEDGATDG